jgi:hypothetical protein
MKYYLKFSTYGHGGNTKLERLSKKKFNVRIIGAKIK